MVATRLYGIGTRLVRCAAALAAICLPSLGAEAQLRRELMTGSTYAYGGTSGTADRGIFGLADASGRLAIDYRSIVSADGGYDFHHDLNCAGICSATVSTWLTDAITNIGSDPIALTFNSVISAGHLDVGGTGGSARFAFEIMQGSAGLYAARGTIDASGGAIVTSDGAAFRGLIATSDGGVNGFGWDDTPISLSLGSLAAGEGTALRFQLWTFVDSVAGGRASLFFRDPVNDGGAPPIPEPGSWILMIAGIGLAGSYMRQRARRPMPAR